VGHDPQPGLRLEGAATPVVAEPDALELRAIVLEREVGVARARDRDPADLALDPQVTEPGIGSDGAADRPRDLTDAQDPETKGAGRPGPLRADAAAGRAWRIGDRVPRRERPVRRLAPRHAPKPSWT
jgi:hypothetical protein